MSVSPARRAAYDILARVAESRSYASELLHAKPFSKLSARDHGLLTELVLGVLRWQGALDQTIARHSAQPLAKLDREVLTALRLGAYQLLFLDRVPAHAAIHESVELVKRARKRSAAGMVNAILRKIPRTGLAADEHFGHPQWLIERWTRIYGPTATSEISTYNQSSPRTVIRAAQPGLAAELEREGVGLQAGRLVRDAFVVTEGDIRSTRAFRERRLTIQDEASQLIALLIGEGQAILDCCAAPGGKTRIMGDENPGSTIIGLELHPRRALLLKRLLPRPGVHVVAADARAMPLVMSFDRVLVDAPCSGTGTLARNPEIKWRLTAEGIKRLELYQLEILMAAMKRVAPGGRIVYSTCSLEPEENEEVMAQALAADPSFHLVACELELEALRSRGQFVWPTTDSLVKGSFLRTLPGVHPCDGFFAAILERS
jgi:16S rRNA (cytosine967-C5)-methyltransferase